MKARGSTGPAVTSRARDVRLLIRTDDRNHVRLLISRVVRLDVRVERQRLESRRADVNVVAARRHIQVLEMTVEIVDDAREGSIDVDLRRLGRHFHPQTAGDRSSGYDIRTDGAVPERIVRKAPTEPRAIESVRRNDGATPQLLVTDDRATAWDGATNRGTAEPACPYRAGGGQYENACEQRRKNEVLHG